MARNPISLRIRNAESTRRARELLAKLDAEDRLQRRIRWLATRALIYISRMHSLAKPKLTGAIDGDRWHKNVLAVESILKRIKQRGL